MDLRHVFETIACLPKNSTQQFDIKLNSVQFEAAARNAILLLLAMTMTESAALEASPRALKIGKAILHIWYSVSIPKDVLLLLQETVKPMILKACEKFRHMRPDIRLGKMWKFSGGRTLALWLVQKDWLRLLGFLDVPKGLSNEKALEIRRAVTLAPGRQDWRDRWYYRDASPSMRLAKHKFQEDGMLLPFGYSRVSFNTPNP